MLAIFENNPAFTVSSLTLALLRQPYVPGLVGRLDLFRPVRLATTTTMVEVQGTRLALVPEVPRGAPPTPNVEDRRAMVSMRVPHFPIRDTIYADSVQNVRAFGSEDALQGVTAVVNDREASMGLKLDVTLEYLRLGAVKGVIVTAADRVTGAPISQIDLFAQFGVQRQPVQGWPIGGAGRVAQERPAWSAQLTGLVNNLSRAMADELPGGMLTRIHGIAGSEFFDAFSMHPERRAAFIALDAGPIIEPNLTSQIPFRDVIIEEYRGRVGEIRFVQPDECHFFPVGVPDLFLEIYAPADYIETVNTIALPRYAKMEAMDFDKGVQLEAQMNVLPLCSAPRALFTAKVTPYSESEAEATAAAAPAGPANSRRERAAH
jgi:Phage major capsid protein E